MIDYFSFGIQNVYGGSTPSLSNLEEYYSMDFRCIISLMANHSQFASYSKTDVNRLGMHWFNIEIEDLFPAKTSDFHALNNIIHDHHSEGKILFHCYAGLGRTGMMAAGLLILNGMTLENAIQQVRKNRPGAIETEAQIEILKKLQ